MRLRLFDRVRRAYRRRLASGTGARARTDSAPGPAGPPGQAGSPGPGGLTGHSPGSHRRVGPAHASGDPVRRTGAGGAASATPGPLLEGRAAGRTAPRRWGAARAAVRSQPGSVEARATQVAQQRKATREAAAATRRPWYEVAQSNRTAVGRRHCGRLEEVVCRDWAQDAVPPPEVVRAIDRLAELPQLIKEKLAAGLDAIYVGVGGVPDLDDMSRLSGVPLPSGRATWDACAGAYGERKIICHVSRDRACP